ncbi:hypothetical protein [Mycolicibacterium fluoranthenivorans]|jgi:hypothetical protein|uniref:DUF1345 domain-containing protein n=1 Tax=Mycolicibacterium fluoranthenivorans TaxID=258505 RepID=A0A1G4WCN5_9MYCO|nr:hypothetical protein [Mycolicibacterium fluoranthenivorans]SCX20393.1 hypothetical protein SAMN02799620_02893 [Mycolicibacterium fluoranthenivorans]
MEPTPQTPAEAFVKRAERIASGAEHHVPSWLRPGEPESRLPVLVAILLAVVLQRAVPDRYTVVPRWPLLAMELMLVVLLVAINPLRLSRRTTAARWGSLALTAAITVDNTASAVMLDYWILRGDVSNDAAVLLGSGGAIFVTNILAFALWYWELDRGGPFARHAVEQPYPDFLFPQMTDPDKAKPDWRPTFVDYMYVSFTNVVAFSPTDTMPLARWAKLMMTVQASVAMSTIALVIARAVNVLK